MTVYAFRDAPYLGFRNCAKADPQRIGEALAGISADHDGRLEPADVVAAARSRRHALHDFFTWDDKHAADSWRLREAQALIRSVEVVDVTVPNEQRKRAFLSITDKEGRSYRDLKTIESDVRLQHLLLEQAIRDLQAFEARYRDLQAICSLVTVARKAAEEQRDATA